MMMKSKQLAVTQTISSFYSTDKKRESLTRAFYTTYP